MSSKVGSEKLDISASNPTHEVIYKHNCLLSKIYNERLLMSDFR